MKKVMFCLVAAIVLFASGCTPNQRARAYGGTITINLPPGTKLVNVTWKDSDIWYLTRPAKGDEKPERFEFIEKSSYGQASGKVVLIESK